MPRNLFFLLSSFLFAGLLAQSVDAESLLLENPLPILEVPEQQPDPCEGAACPDDDERPDGELAFDPGHTVTVFNDVPHGVFPSVAMIAMGKLPNPDKKNRWHRYAICTATLIAPQVILTAQHCVVSKEGKMLSQISVRLREAGNSPIHTQTINLSHQNTALYKDGFKVDEGGKIKWSATRDLALVRLNNPVPNAEMRVAPLLTATMISKFRRLTFVGYGKQYINFTTGEVGGPRRLAMISNRQVPMNFVGSNLKDRSFRVSGTVQIGGDDVAVSLCNGDSGGPFFVSDPASPTEVVLAGVNHAVLYGGSAEACAKLGNQSFLVGVIGNMGFINAGLEKLNN